MSDIDEMNRVIARSEEFESELAHIFQTLTFGTDNKNTAILTTYKIAQEHALALRELTKLRLLTSGMSLLRLQYEAMVRQLWFQYIASDTAIEKLVAPLNASTEQAASNSIPTCTTMLLELEKKGPAGLHKHLDAFKGASWKALNSYVHSGIHAISRHRNGYPAQLFSGVIRQSNNLTHLSAVGLAEHSQNIGLPQHIALMYKKYADCLQLT
jgi:hypothetical protein